MGHSKQDVVEAALGILDEHGLPGLSMRRVAATLEVQQSALYWHFESKQVLLAAMAEEILRRGPRASSRGTWDAVVTRRAGALRDALLAYRDGAEVVSTVYAFGLGANAPHQDLAACLEAAGATTADARAAATVIVHFVFGFTFSEQQYHQASSAGAIRDVPAPNGVRRGTKADPFRAGIALVLDGIRARLT
ncbi:MAG TPA: TetR/AcrR family transcriptional regulator C-terminal domain-containing protein [Nocardioidaceae bacterium]|jgi:AcrR family transcriptional regulator|nr:TetR/AcrR family transcriptional regulator C-terminal domain-containing protein [Nocardioidaceae bacterium]